MKLAGVLLLCSAYLICAILVVRGKRARLDALRELCAALDLMKGELVLSEASFPELSRSLSERAAGIGKELFSELSARMRFLKDEKFITLWENAVENCCADLNETDREELLLLGASLGRYDIHTQLRAIQTCRDALQSNKEKAQQTYAAESRLWLGLSATAGALSAVLLL